MDIGNGADAKVVLDCCRICVSQCDERCSMYELIDYEDFLSLHSMLRKLFPAIFSLDQQKYDRSKHWPDTICQDCKCKVIDAYALYENCEKSFGLLSQQQVVASGCTGPITSNKENFCAKPLENIPQLTEEVFIRSTKLSSTITNERVCERSIDRLSRQQLETIRDGVPIARKEKQITNDRSEQVSLLADQNQTFDEHLSVELVVHDKDSAFPQPVPESKRTLPSKRQIVIRKVKKAKSKQTNNNEVKGVTDKCAEPRLKPPSEDGNISDEKSKENFHLESIVPQTSHTSLAKVKRNKPKGEKGLGTNVGSPNTTHTDPEELQTKIDLYHCCFCDAPTFSSPTELTAHLKANHPNQLRHCEHCPKVFVTQTAFEQHQYCHATGRSFFCTFCDKGFQTEKLRKSHVQTHTQQSDYLCSHCGKTFKSKSNLRQHLNGHLGHKPWACNLCPCRFSTKGGLVLHQNTHTKKKSFSCDTCGSQFNKHYSLIKHKLVHTGERPFGCSVCDMRFATSYMVKRHMRTHTGEKPFKCTYCERSFAQSNDMVKHMKIHVGSTPYQCDRCDASFRLLTDLRNHYKEHYQTGALGPGSSPERGGGIRFTSIDILQLRYKRERETNNRSEAQEEME